jgi:hypothetical protein
MGGWQSGDDISDRYYDLVSDGPERDADRYTRRVDLPGNVQVAFYREPLRLPGIYLWIVSRSHLDEGDFHEWIYRARRRAEEQWFRERAVGCIKIGSPARHAGQPDPRHASIDDAENIMQLPITLVGWARSGLLTKKPAQNGEKA